MVGGVTPGKGGTEIEGFPVFDTVRDAVDKTGANAIGDLRARPPSPPTPSWRRSTPGIELVCCITEGIPVLDMVKVKRVHAGERKPA